MPAFGFARRAIGRAGFLLCDEGVEPRYPPMALAIFALTLHQRLPYCEGDIRALNLRLVLGLATLAQSVEHSFRKAGVQGSSP